MMRNNSPTPPTSASTQDSKSSPTQPVITSLPSENAIPTSFTHRTMGICPSYGPCGIQERAILCSGTTPISTLGIEHNFLIEAEISTDNIVDTIFLPPVLKAVDMVSRVSMSIRSPTLDNKYRFLAYLDIVVKGMFRVFGGDSMVTVNVNAISRIDFEKYIVSPMRCHMDMYPMLFEDIPKEPGEPLKEGCIWVSDLHSFECDVHVGGEIEDYGIKLCMSNGNYILRFATS